MAALALAFGAGLLSTVNPCGFAMLPAFLAFHMGAEAPGGSPAPTLRFLHGVTIGLALSAGFALVFVVTGILLSVGLRSIITVVPWVAVGIGVVLAGVGVAMLSGRHVGVSLGPSGFERGESRGHGRVFLFGMAYALASLSCTVAVFLAIIAQALASADPVRLVGIFIAYALGAAALLTALSASTAIAKGVVRRAIRRLLPISHWLGGGLLVLSGIYLVAYWLPALVNPSGGANRAVAGISQGPSAFLTALFAAHQTVLAILGALIVAGGAAVALRARRARPQQARRGGVSPESHDRRQPPDSDALSPAPSLRGDA